MAKGSTSNRRRFGIVLAVAAIFASGCAAAKEDASGQDAGIDAPPDEPARLSLTFDGPAEGSEIRVATRDANMLCLEARANAALELRALRTEISSPEGLFLDTEAQYRAWKVVDAPTGIAASAPIELSPAERESQAIIYDLGNFSLLPATPRKLCVQTDVQNEHELDGNHLAIKLLPFEPGDVTLREDGSPLPGVQIDPVEPIRSDLVIAGIRAAESPMRRPTVMLAELPTTGLQLGEIVAFRATFTAPPEDDVLIAQLSFRTQVFLNGDASETQIANARLARPNQPSLPAAADIQVSGGGCTFVASWSMRCIIIRLEEPLRIAAGMSETIELRLLVSGSLVHGEQLITFFVRDAFGPQQGPLTRGRIASEYPNNVMWSNDGLWWYNGYYVQWGDAFSTPLVLGYYAPG